MKPEPDEDNIAFGVGINANEPNHVILTAHSGVDGEPKFAWQLDREQWAKIRELIDGHFNRKPH